MVNAVITYLKEAVEELRRVAWPTKQETIQHTLIVLGLSFVLGLFLGAIDYALNFGLERLFLYR